ncbi:protein EFR3 homolog A isoform X2 [Octopus sinensis]|uniref:Protein EFR3 homolog A isoform X2 n=1 Tax=Octopus sinensis TaxID=2607531 RepID=A0A7E6FNN4_9MOLL|nr:protein EFR3 homolog A isoform X2 [Octopus sinensis]
MAVPFLTGNDILNGFKANNCLSSSSRSTDSDEPEIVICDLNFLYPDFGIGSCFCCVALKPRYKRLVDNIFPTDPQDGLVKSNMEKLLFYALSTPEKLDRIGEYLAQRVNRDIHRHRRIGFVFLAMDALDQLLVACHAQAINLFVESYLKMVQKLLEYDNVDLQILATSSFVKFTNIEEDTPSYHRRYDFFVSRFSAMCHCDEVSESDRLKIRTAGLRGIQGVVRKTVSDELQVNIWESVHMDKIVPSLLYNMHDPSSDSLEPESPRNEDDPALVAATTFRDLVCRASFGSIKSVLKPVLVHLDLHKLWVPNDFAIKCFKIIMYSIQAKYSYLVLQMLMSHLDTHQKSEPMIKANIIDVLFQTVLIAAGGSVGPSVLEVFDTLLRHLRVSVDSKYEEAEKTEMERKFQEVIINTIGEFANNLPDYQKIDTMMFVLGKLPQKTNHEDYGTPPIDIQLQNMLLKTLLKVATKYQTVVMMNAFPPEFLIPLLKMSQVEEPALRLIVQDILHTLIDRHGNTQKLKNVCMLKDLSELTIETTPRQDIMFMKKNGNHFYHHLYENIEMNSNHVENFEALYCTMALILVELGSSDLLVDLCRLALDIQHMVCTNNHLPITHKCAIHGLLAAYLNLLCHLMSIPAFSEHVNQVLESRSQEASFLLPEFAFNRKNKPSSYPIDFTLRENWLFSQKAIAESLQNNGHDTAGLDVPFSLRPLGIGDTSDMTHSTSDIHSVNLDFDSTNGSPTVPKKVDDVTFDALKKMLNEEETVNKDEEEKKRLQIFASFRDAPFEEIMARSEAKSNQFHNKLNEILDLVSNPPESPSSTTNLSSPDAAVAVFSMQIPDLYVY